MTKMFLDRGNIPYEYIDVTEDESAAERIKALGYQQTPVVIVPAEYKLETPHWSGLRHDLLSLLPGQAA